MGGRGGETAATKRKKGRPSLLDLQNRAIDQQQNKTIQQRRSSRRNPNPGDGCSIAEDEYSDEEGDDRKSISYFWTGSSSVKLPPCGSDSNADVVNRIVKSGSGGVIADHLGEWVGEKQQMESRIKEAMRSRQQHLRDLADSLSVERVRRLLEKDLGLDTYALDVHKSYVKQLLEEMDDSVNDDVSTAQIGDHSMAVDSNFIDTNKQVDPLLYDHVSVHTASDSENDISDNNRLASDWAGHTGAERPTSVAAASVSNSGAGNMNPGEVAQGNIHKSSYLNAVVGSAQKRKVNFRLMENEGNLDEGIDVILPMASVKEAADRYCHTLYGYFLGKRMAFPVVQHYVMNTWKKYGIERAMMNAKGFYFFKFASERGMLDVLENGPWMIRNIPIILNQWTPNVSLTKENLTRIPVWVKLFDVPLAGFNEDGLSLIASKIGTPMRLDSYTSSMCLESWGRPSYARAMIEVSAKDELKESLKVATPKLDGMGNTMDTVSVEYEWQPPRCSCCKVFGHTVQQCPKDIMKIVDRPLVNDKVDRLVERPKGKGLAIERPRQGPASEGFVVGKPKQKNSVYVRKNVDRSKSGLEARTGKKHDQVGTSNTFEVLSTLDANCDKQVAVAKGKFESNVVEDDLEDYDIYGDLGDEGLTEAQRAFCKDFDFNLRGKL